MKQVLSRTLLVLVILACIFVLALLLAPISVSSKLAIPGSGGGPGSGGALALFGYAWSPNIGWISFANNGFSGPVYGVTLLSDGSCADCGGGGYRYLGGTFDGGNTGYAWSPAVGWIKFSSNIGSNFAPGDGWPATDLNDRWGVRMDIYGRFSGWARACAVFQSGCSGALRSQDERGGWDGWIKFAGTNYQVRADSGSNPARLLGNDISYIWGGNDVFGWLSPCAPFYNGVDDYCIRFGGLGGSCEILPQVNGVTTIDDGDIVTWRATAVGGRAPYYFSWYDVTDGPNESAGPQVGAQFDVNKVYRLDSPPPDGPGAKAGSVLITDSDNHSAACEISTNVVINPIPPNPGGGGGDTDLTDPAPDTISIRQHPLGAVAISSQTVLGNRCVNSCYSQPVRIKSIDSLVTPGVSLLGNADVFCRFDGTAIDPVNPDNGFAACAGTTFPIPGNTNNSDHPGAYFNIKVGKPSATISAGNPYRVTLAVASSTGQDISTKTFIFDYAVGTIKPL